MELSKAYEPAIAKMQEAGLDIVKIKREISFALQLLNKNQRLQECSANSKMAAIVNIANIGLTLNPAAKEAYLLPRWSSVTKENECCLEPSYIGLVKLLTDAGSIKNILCNLVNAFNDRFAHHFALIRYPCAGFDLSGLKCLVGFGTFPDTQ